MEYILKYFPEAGSEKIHLLASYQEQLRWWNARINLISRQDIEELEVRHLLHSLAIARHKAFPAGAHILDLGTGGGLPGIPLAIWFPVCHFTLIDGRGKKIRAVQAMIRTLGLANADAIHVRAEDMQGNFDCIVSRAVAPLKDLWAWSRAIRRSGQDEGKPEKGLIALKGGDMREEINALGPTVDVHTVAIGSMFQEDYFYEKWVVEVNERTDASRRKGRSGGV